MSSRLFISYLDRYHITREILDNCAGCRLSDWVEKPSSYYILCSYHEGWKDAMDEVGGMKRKTLPHNPKYPLKSFRVIDPPPLTPENFGDFIHSLLGGESSDGPYTHTIGLQIPEPTVRDAVRYIFWRIRTRRDR